MISKAEKRLAEIERECHSYPVVDSLDKPPGRDASGVWRGRICWSKKMPDGTLWAYTTEHAFRVLNLRAENYGDTRFIAERCAPEAHDKNIWRIYSPCEKRYIWGHIHDVSPSPNFIFREDASLWRRIVLGNEFSAGNRQALHLKIFDSKKIRKYSQESIDFAEDLYKTLTNNIFYNKDTDSLESMSFYMAAWVVAAIREAGEDYLDFYCIGDEGTASLEVENLLSEIGVTRRS